MTDSRAAILSPHYDDAVLSCWHLLAAPGDVAVVNVFTAEPAPGTVGWWDRVTGAEDSSARLRERRWEDAAALGLARRSSVDLGLLDAQYRNGDAPDVLDTLRSLELGDVVYAPAGLGLHADHELVREAALELADNGADVRFYADMPHAAELAGWPEWVTGEADDPYVDADAGWDFLLQRSGLELARLAPEACRLDDDAWEAKLAAMQSYRTQVGWLKRTLPLEQLRYEVVWSAP
jgi:LmbE family N-acetylglucosaminyl deacetylase